MLFNHPKMFCCGCYEVVQPKLVSPGSFAVELVLWLLLIVPGLIYSVYRATAKQDTCPNCGSHDFTKPDSKRAQMLLAQVEKAMPDSNIFKAQPIDIKKSA